MPSKLPKFEDWTPPWGDDDSNLDPKRAARLIYDLHRDKERLQERNTNLESERDELKGKVEAFEEKDMTELDKAKKRIAELEGKIDGGGQAPAGPSKLEIALEIAEGTDLTLAQVRTMAKRITGDSEDALREDAKAYLEEHGFAGKGKGGEDEDGSGRPPSRRPSPQEVRTGTRGGDAVVPTIDPEKLMSELPSLL